MSCISPRAASSQSRNRHLTHLISDNFPTQSVIRWSPSDCTPFSSYFPRIRHRKERHLALMVSVIPSDLKHPSFANTNVVFHMPQNLLKPSNLDNQGLNSLPSRLACTKQSVLVNLLVITRYYGLSLCFNPNEWDLIRHRSTLMHDDRIDLCTATPT